MGRARLREEGWARAGIGLLAFWGTACSTLGTSSQHEPKPSLKGPSSAEGAAPEAALRACHASALVQQPGLSVHTVALYFARDGKVVFADVELPEYPQLERCLEDALLGSPAIAGPSGIVGGGGRPIDLGAPPLTRPRRPTLAEVRERHRRMTLEALRRGALKETDALVQEVLNPSPPWPTAPMRGELDACHRAALEADPGLVVHREVLYVARDGKVLLADVDLSEAPELQRCVLERVQSWSSPPLGTESVLSGFFMDLGGPEEFPDPPPTLAAARARRVALVDRAVALGLIRADDPLRERLRGRSLDPAGSAPAKKAAPPTRPQ
jgi:hypothetical protein